MALQKLSLQKFWVHTFFFGGSGPKFFGSVNAPLISTLFYGILVYISSYIIICMVWYTCISGFLLSRKLVFCNENLL